MAVGAPVGAYRAHTGCEQSLLNGALRGPMQDGTWWSAGQSESYWPFDRTGWRR
jgi:hypothetical protein